MTGLQTAGQMSGVRKIEHARVRVRNLTESLIFYRDVMGLVELERDDEAVYLGCGYDGGYDLAVTESGTGVEHVAVRVDDPDRFAELEDRLSAAEVELQRLEDAEPGEELALRFSLPSGVEMELVRVDHGEYLHPAAPEHGRRPGHAPLDLDHANLATTRVKADTEFLRNLGFQLSDVRYSGDEWIQTFVRLGDHHHDVALTGVDDSSDTLHHLAWEMPSIQRIKSFADRLATEATALEMGGIGRHQAGGCIFAYFREPGGNRFELCTEMPTLDADTAVTYRDADAEESSISAWGPVVVPSSFGEGS